jgi:hypothetical protein
MWRATGPSKEEEQIIKNEIARLLAELQPGEWCTEEDIMTHSLAIRRILAYHFDPACDDEGDDLAPNDTECVEREVQFYPVCPEKCNNCPGYLVNHFTDEKVDCQYKCHVYKAMVEEPAPSAILGGDLDRHDI